jgi:hypothetical protein
MLLFIALGMLTGSQIQGCEINNWPHLTNSSKLKGRADSITQQQMCETRCYIFPFCRAGWLEVVILSEGLGKKQIKCNSEEFRLTLIIKNYIYRIDRRTDGF